MALVWGGVWGTITVVKEVERPVGDSATTLATCEGRSEEIVYASEDRSNKNGGASKENGELRSEKARPATVLARGPGQIPPRPEGKHLGRTRKESFGSRAVLKLMQSLRQQLEAAAAEIKEISKCIDPDILNLERQV